MNNMIDHVKYLDVILFVNRYHVHFLDKFVKQL